MEHNMLISQTAKEPSIDELFQRLSSNKKGLSASEAEGRQQQYGYNEIAGKKIVSPLKLLSYFLGPHTGMIEVAAILSAVAHHWEDFRTAFVRFLGQSRIKTLIRAAHEQKH
jgi:H+-transporting ATPase